MIVQRFTYEVKKGRAEKAIELVKSEIARYAPAQSQTWRIYTDNIGRFWMLAIEVEFESLADLEGYWAKWFEDPEAVAFLEKFNKTLKSGGTEVWNLVE